MSTSTDQRIHAHISTRQHPRIATHVLLFTMHVLMLLSWLALPASAQRPVTPPRLFIVQAASSDEAAAATARATGRISRQLDIIGGVSAIMRCVEVVEVILVHGLADEVLAPGRTAPVIKLDAAEARNSSAPRKSSGSPKRPSGMRPRKRL